MNLRSSLAVIALLTAIGTPPALAQKDKLDDFVRAHENEAWKVAQQIWRWAEPGFQETRSAELLAETLEDAGFKVERGVADMPTAFTATFGSGSPVIGVMGEFDALPGLSQDAVPHQQALPDGHYGHACGHHLFGAASVYASIAIADQIRSGNMKGTIRFYGTPAEEGGHGKTFMVRDGLFEDCDAVLHWHPGGGNAFGDPSCNAVIGVKFRFFGESAHAAAAPEQGRSALDAVELTNHAAQLLREHTPEESRFHHVITAGGNAPNIVPNFAEVFFYVRNPDPTILQGLYDRLLKCAEAGALATETRLEVDFIGGTYPLLPNDTLSKVTQKNFEQLLDITYSKEEETFIREIQKTLPHPDPLDSIKDITDNTGNITKGSTDVGDVSYVVPTTGFRTMCWAPGTPAHSWQATASGGHSIGRKGMLLAARILAANAWDLAHSPETLKKARNEFDNRLDGITYAPLLEPGQKPPLNYRDPPKN
jgi:aminobenzoyl-glutamate utilization protein B